MDSLQRGKIGIAQNGLCGGVAAQIGFRFAVDYDHIRVPGQQLLQGNVHPGSAAQLQVRRVDGVDRVDNLSVGGTGWRRLQRLRAVSVVDAELVRLCYVHVHNCLKRVLRISGQLLSLLLRTGEHFSQKTVYLRYVRQLVADHQYRNAQAGGELVRLFHSRTADGGEMDGNCRSGGYDGLIIDAVPHAEVGQIVVFLQNDALFYIVEPVIPPQQLVRGQCIQINGGGGVGGKCGLDVYGDHHCPSGHIGDAAHGLLIGQASAAASRQEQQRYCEYKKIFSCHGHPSFLFSKIYRIVH